MATVRVGNVELYYEVHGQGVPLLLVPGLGGDVRVFGALVEGLARTCRVVAFDPRGAGRSDKPAGPYSIAEMTQDAVGVLDAVGMAEANVLGFSLGGRVALDLAQRRPDRVASLMLVSTAARTSAYARWSRRWWVMDVVARLPLPRWLDPQPRAAHLAQRAASRAYDGSARLGEIRVPTLVLHGRRDRIVSLDLAVELQRGIPGARLMTVSGGHMTFLTTHRKELAEAVAQFLSTSGDA